MDKLFGSHLQENTQTIPVVLFVRVFFSNSKHLLDFKLTSSNTGTIFQTVSNELKSGMFDMLILCPASKDELYVPNPRCKDISRFTFLGQLMGIALSSKVHLDISLADICWKLLVGQNVSWEDIASIDKNFKIEFEDVKLRLRREGEVNEEEEKEEYEDSNSLYMIVKSIDGSKYALFSGGEKVRVRGKDMMKNWMKLAEEYRLNELKVRSTMQAQSTSPTDRAEKNPNQT
jgi:hypothetical protein